MTSSLPAQRLSAVAKLRLAMTAVVAVAIGLFTHDVWRIVEAVDERSYQREKGRLTSAIVLLGETTAAEHLVIANLQQLYHSVSGAPDLRWIEDHFWPATVLDAREMGFLLGRDGRVMAAKGNGRAGMADVEQDMLAAVQPLLLRLQADLDRDLKTRAQGDLHRGHYSHYLVRLGQAPALVTAIAIAPALARTETELPVPVLVHVTPFDAATTQSLARLASLPALEVVGDGAAPEPGTARLALHARDGRPVGAMSWIPDRPGARVLEAFLPVLVISVLLLLLVSASAYGGLLRLLRRLLGLEASARHAALTDALTGLPNRRSFEAAFAEARGAPGEMFGVVLLDLDHFKTINDTLGHAAGDAAITTTADRLSALGSDCRLAARLGGDEFALITGAMADKDVLAAFCARLAAELARPMTWSDRRIDLSASIGGALCPADGETLAEVLASADKALYWAKEGGRGRAETYDAVTESRRLESRIARIAGDRRAPERRAAG
jgi:diguanylate cyclase (GGDEF)-like protein